MRGPERSGLCGIEFPIWVNALIIVSRLGGTNALSRPVYPYVRVLSKKHNRIIIVVFCVGQIIVQCITINVRLCTRRVHRKATGELGELVNKGIDCASTYSKFLLDIFM